MTPNMDAVTSQPFDDTQSTQTRTKTRGLAMRRRFTTSPAPAVQTGRPLPPAQLCGRAPDDADSDAADDWDEDPDSMPPVTDDPRWWAAFESDEEDEPDPEPGDFWPEED